jgi:hypothetical protein
MNRANLIGNHSGLADCSISGKMRHNAEQGSRPSESSLDERTDEETNLGTEFVS